MHLGSTCIYVYRTKQIKSALLTNFVRAEEIALIFSISLSFTLPPKNSQTPEGRPFAFRASHLTSPQLLPAIFLATSDEGEPTLVDSIPSLLRIRCLNQLFPTLSPACNKFQTALAMPASASALQLIHLGSVTFAHDNGPYAVRGRVGLVFRDGPDSLNVTSFRLEPERPPASEAAAPTSIPVMLQRQWGARATDLRKGSLVQVDSPLVRRSEDPTVNSLCLALHDPMESSNSKAALHILDDDCVPVRTLACSTLHSGFVEPPIVNGAPPAATPALWASNRGIASSSRAPNGNVYTPIAKLWDMTMNSATGVKKDIKVNIYGIIVDCRAPCLTRGPDLRCEIVVADESSLRDGSNLENLKTITIHCFERTPAGCIPFRGVGDVIRVHRINYGRYIDRMTGVSTVQGVGRFYSTFVIWSYEGTDFTPVANRKAVTTRNQVNYDTREPNELVTSYDRQRVPVLRSWAASNLEKVQQVKLPYLRTVLEVKSAPPGTEFLSKSFDLLCVVEADIPDETDEGVVKFIISDGLLNRSDRKERLLVESIISPDHLIKARRHSFLDFCPSWQSRPTTYPAWLLIRDVRASVQGSGCIMQLSVGKKTSTLIWRPSNSVEVRKAKESFRRSHGVGAPHAAIDVAGASIGTDPTYYSNDDERRRRGAAGHAGDQLNGGRDANNANNRAGQKRSRPNPLLHAAPVVPSSPPQRKAARGSAGGVGSTEGRANGSGSNQFDESRAKTLQRNFNRNTMVISTHSNKSFNVSTIRDMQKDVGNKILRPHRLKVTASSCISPREVQYACRPWCAACEQFLKVDGNGCELECLKCGVKCQTAGGLSVDWAYSVRLNLEDGSGGRVECWIEGNEAEELFCGIPATNLLEDVKAQKQVSKCLRAVLNPKNRLDCCVKPYEYQDEHGVYWIACKLFATSLLPQVLSG